MIIRSTPIERVTERLLRGIPKPKPFGRMIDGRFITGHTSLHRTPQGVRWNAFLRTRNRLRKT